MDRQPLSAVADKEHVSKQGKRVLNGPVTVALWVTQFGGVTPKQSHVCPSPNCAPVDTHHTFGHTPIALRGALNCASVLWGA